MKIYFLALLLLAGAVVWYTVPITRETILCYQMKKLEFDEIGFRTHASNWSQRRGCEEKTDSTIRLAECLEAVRTKRNKTIMTYLEPYIRESIRLVLPYVQSYEQQKEEVNAECGGYPDLLID